MKTGADGFIIVVAAYSITLRSTFSVLIIFGIFLVAIAIPIKLPDDDVTEDE